MLKKLVKKAIHAFYPRLFPDPPIDISDDAVNWICFANAGMLERGNLYSFDYAIRKLPPGNAPILEIGSFCGLSTNLLVYYMLKHGVKNRLINCDRWDFEGATAGENIAGTTFSHSEYREFCRDTYLRNVRMFSRTNLPFTLEMYSDEFFRAWEDSAETTDIFGRSIRLGGPLGFCYIDGNHSYEFAKRDFLNCHRYLVPGGFLLFDDSADGCGFEVTRVIEEVKASGQYEIVIKNPNYLFRKRNLQ